MSGGRTHFIGGRWVEGEGPPLTSTDPATGDVSWSGREATAREVDLAVAAARAASPAWARTPLAERVAKLHALAEQYKQRKADFAQAISRETGKPRWEALAEVDAMIAKVAISVEAFQRRTSPTTATPSPGVTAATRFKPHGVVAVFGPFNMPGHLPNGHLVPALLAGNTAVFKPSEQAPLVGQLMLEACEAASVPAGVVNLVQGGASAGRALAAHPDLDGIFFTGSGPVGIALSRALADRPGTILALEMGGNNPLVVHDCADLVAAALLTIQSAYLTAGQRCSCARRLIVPVGAPGDAFVAALVRMIGRVRAGLPTDDPEPFLGPVISAKAADSLLAAQSDLVNRGGRPLAEMTRSSRSPALLTPGLVDVTAVAQRADAELFGPILQLVRVADFDAAIREANATRYGLSAGLFSDRRELYERFYAEVRAGVVNWNRPLTGAASTQPFGGVGLSGNHRPSAYYAADYCSYPVASMEVERVTMPAQPPIGVSE